MDNLTENKDYYATHIQRDVLVSLVTNPTIEEFFFLTGGTALSIFYLHHRLSNDFYFIQKLFPERDIEQIYNNARTKEAIFDDPPTAAFQIEEWLAFLKENQTVFPQILVDFDMHDFFRFYNKITNWLYKRVKI